MFCIGVDLKKLKHLVKITSELIFFVAYQPTTVDNLPPYNVTSTSLQLRWRDNNPDRDERYYNITWYSKEGSLNKLSFVTGNSAQVRNLTSNAQYTFNITAFNSVGDVQSPAVLTTKTRK